MRFVSVSSPHNVHVLLLRVVPSSRIFFIPFFGNGNYCRLWIIKLLLPGKYTYTHTHTMYSYTKYYIFDSEETALDRVIRVLFRGRQMLFTNKLVCFATDNNNHSVTVCIFRSYFFVKTFFLSYYSPPRSFSPAAAVLRQVELCVLKTHSAALSVSENCNDFGRVTKAGEIKQDSSSPFSNFFPTIVFQCTFRRS